jgi:hypothetical protein
MKLATKVPVLHACLQSNYGGYTNNSKVNLSVSLGNYHVLAKILSKNIAFMYNLSMPEIIRIEILKDLRTIRTILEKSERGVEK